MKTNSLSKALCPECGSDELRATNIEFKVTEYYWWVCCKCGQSPEGNLGAERYASVCELYERLWHTWDGELCLMGDPWPSLKDIHVLKREPVLYCTCCRGVDKLWENPGDPDDWGDSFWIVQCRQCGHWLKSGWEGSLRDEPKIPETYPDLDEAVLHAEPVNRRHWQKTFGAVRKKGGLWLPTVAIETYPKRMKKTSGKRG